MLKIKLLALVLIVAAVGVFVYRHNQDNNPASATVADSVKKAVQTVPQQTTSTNYCAGNTLGREVIVSISKQRMWDCAGSTTAYDNPVVTGMAIYAADLTPTGTYHIYGRQTDQTLAGHDSTGSWSDPVSYWLPFLDNQYGTYGFHDATWRADSDFGTIDINNPYTAVSHGSHGCVEMPLAAAKWLYNWSSVGTTVIIQS